MDLPQRRREHGVTEILELGSDANPLRSVGRPRNSRGVLSFPPWRPFRRKADHGFNDDYWKQPDPSSNPNSKISVTPCSLCLCGKSNPPCPPSPPLRSPLPVLFPELARAGSFHLAEKASEIRGVFEAELVSNF